MATEIPSAITIPDSVDTRLGTLRFVDGFPDDTTVERVFDNLDFQRGVQAFLAAMPAASVGAQRRALERFGPHNQTQEHCNVFMYYYPKLPSQVICF